MPFGLLSASLLPTTRAVSSNAASTGPRPRIPMTLLPAPQPRRLHASEIAHDVLPRDLYESGAADLLEAHEPDPPVGRLLVVLHGKRERRRGEPARNLGREPTPLEQLLETRDRPVVAA